MKIKFLKRVVLFSLFAICFIPYLYAAQLNDIYLPLIKDNILYESEIYYFGLEETGIHGNASYDKFESEPYFYYFKNLLKFSPIKNLELALGFNTVTPSKYKRLTYTPNGNLSVVQKYDIDYFFDYLLGIRTRKGPLEIYLDILEKRQKTAWDSSTHPAPPSNFNYIRAHYDNFKAGVRYLSNAGEPQEKSNLSKYRRPLISENQINIESELEYRHGKLRRYNDYYLSGSYYLLNFFHDLKGHLTPKFVIRYGLSRNLEIESGIYYTTPHKYIYEYKEFGPLDASLFITGHYKTKNQFQIPFKLRFRPKEWFEVAFSSVFSFVKQRLDYWRKSTSNTVTVFPSKELSYYNIQPTLLLTYFYNNDKKINSDNLSSLTKDLLRKGQFIVDLKFQKDFTHLSKNADNGPLNFIDTYNAFLYPLDYYVINSRYATFLTGNTSRFVTNINPQNFYLSELAFTYGITDNFNAGLKLGYHSSCAVHHFTLYDINSRFYKYKPYYYIDFMWDWRVNENSLISFNSHFVPEYLTLLDIQGNPQLFKARTKYLEISLSAKILF